MFAENFFAERILSDEIFGEKILADFSAECGSLPKNVFAENLINPLRVT